MNALNPILVLGTAFLAVFLQSTFVGFRNLVGVQPDLLPGLVVYASLTTGLSLGTATAVLGGLWLDSLSTNPLGVSMVPLFIIAIIIERYRGLILRDQTYAQFMIGMAASAGAPLVVLLLLLNMSRVPLIGWGSIWQLVVCGLVGGAMTPVWFSVFGWLIRKLSYDPLPESVARPNREIKRGRS